MLNRPSNPAIRLSFCHKWLATCTRQMLHLSMLHTEYDMLVPPSLLDEVWTMIIYVRGSLLNGATVKTIWNGQSAHVQSIPGWQEGVPGVLPYLHR